MRIRLLSGSLALLGAVLTACGGGEGGGGGPNPTPGALDVNLNSASTSPGAIMFTVSGEAITSVSVVGGYHLYETELSSTSRKILVTGNLVAGTLVQIQVPDIAKVGSYSVSVNQVAARSTAAVPYQQLGTAGFGMGVSQ